MLQENLMLYNRLNNDQKKIERDYSYRKALLSKQNCTVQDCCSFLPMNTKDSIKSKLAKEAMIHYVQSCPKQRLCEIVGTLNINVLVDILLKKLNYIKQNDISIDMDLEKTCYISIFGIAIPYYFKAYNIILKGLPNLKRAEDAVISNVGRTQSIQAGFKFFKAKFQLNYEFTCTFITFSGNIFLTVDGSSIAAKLITDYDKTCNVNLEYVKVKIGQIALLRITGLGLFTNLLTNQLTHIINTELHNKIEEIEEHIKKTIEQPIQNFIYENYSIEVLQS